MKLVIVTAVEVFQEEVLNIFKKANIKNFSSSDIDGHKNRTSVLVASNWFSGVKSSNESTMFFSFTNEEKIETLFELIKDKVRYVMNFSLKTWKEEWISSVGKDNSKLLKRLYKGLTMSSFLSHEPQFDNKGNMIIEFATFSSC